MNPKVARGWACIGRRAPWSLDSEWWVVVYVYGRERSLLNFYCISLLSCLTDSLCRIPIGQIHAVPHIDDGHEAQAAE